MLLWSVKIDQQLPAKSISHILALAALRDDDFPSDSVPCVGGRLAFPTRSDLVGDLDFLVDDEGMLEFCCFLVVVVNRHIFFQKLPPTNQKFLNDRAALPS